MQGRVWVLQEVVNAKKATLYAGSGQCDWDTVAALTRWLSIYDVNGPLNIRETICALPAVDMIWKLSRIKEDPRKPPLPRLLDVLADSRLCKSTFPIDKIYGVLGLVCDEDASKIQVDYEIEAADLYTQVAVSELSRTGLDILYFSTKSAEASTVNCPSWVPDWSRPCYHSPFIRLGYKSSAAGTSSTRFRVEKSTLIVRGRLVDTVQLVELSRKIPTSSETVPGTGDELKPDETENAVPGDDDIGFTKVDGLPPFKSTPDAHFNNKIFADAQWFPNAIKIAFPDNKMTPDSFEAFWRTCCCNRTIDGEVVGPDFADCFSDWTKAMTGLKLRDFEEYQAKARKFMESFSRFCNNRRLFRSEKSRFGWGPDQVRAGDVLCVLNGGSIPLVLRPAGTSGFEVIGDAYAHGMMDGEAMDMGLEEKDIYLV